MWASSIVEVEIPELRREKRSSSGIPATLKTINCLTSTMAAGAMTLSPPVSDMEKAMLSTPSPPRSPSPSVDEEEEGWNGEAGTLVEQDDVEDNRTTSAVRSKTCPTCGREFKKISRLNQHILTHSDVKPFVCPVPGCGKAYKRREHLKNHATSHGTTPEERKPFVCEFEGCGASFSNAHHRNRHQKVHADGGRYKASINTYRTDL